MAVMDIFHCMQPKIHNDISTHYSCCQFKPVRKYLGRLQPDYIQNKIHKICKESGQKIFGVHLK